MINILNIIIIFYFLSFIIYSFIYLFIYLLNYFLCQQLNRMIEKNWYAIAQSILNGDYKKADAPRSYYDPKKLTPSLSGGLSDCGTKVDLSPSELYDQLRLLRDVTLETLRFMTAMCQATEFEELFGF